MKQQGIKDFVNQRIWVIGASSGIGESCARALLNAGAKVALSSRRAERLIEVAASVQGTTLILPLDVTQENQIASAYQSILENWGGLDLLLFVSGMYTPLRADNFDFDIAQKTIDARQDADANDFKRLVREDLRDLSIKMDKVIDKIAAK